MRIRDFFPGLIGGPDQEQQRQPAAGRAARGDWLESFPTEPKRRELYQVGDMIGNKYEVYDVLGKGGLGLVYLVYCHESQEVCAIKTFRDEFLADGGVREAFHREALLWVSLEEHPFIVPARFVERISGRLFVQMDYVPPDTLGRVSLADHLTHCTGPLDTDQILKWAIQFCLGMEHAHARGIRCHQDIKPDNILIGQDGTAKISDFGLAAAAEAWGGTQPIITSGRETGFGLSVVHTRGKGVCGTPGYIAPEVYRGEGADVRSDIYSFGIVLWQMAAGSPLPPFQVRFTGDVESYLEAVYREQMVGRIPKVAGPLGPLLNHCLEPAPERRFKGFRELRRELEPILRQRTCQTVKIPEVSQRTAVFWSNKGAALANLQRSEKAIACFDRALEIDPRYAMAWSNKGIALADLGRAEEVIACYDKTLEIDPGQAGVWNNKGQALSRLRRREESITCYDKALEIDPRYAMVWNNKGNTLSDLGRHEEAITCYDKALEIDPRYAMVWSMKGMALAVLGRREQSLACFNKAVEIDPRYAAALSSQGISPANLGRRAEATACHDKVLESTPQAAVLWAKKGGAFAELGRDEEAIVCFNKALEIAPRYATAWCMKGLALAELFLSDTGLVLFQHRKEAVACLQKALEITPNDAKAWSIQGVVLACCGFHEDAARSYRKFLELASPEQATEIARVREWLRQFDARNNK